MGILSFLSGSKKAMDTALYTSFVADLFSDVLTILIVVPLAALSVAFGPRELFTLMLLALIMIILLIENHKPIRALCSILIGLFLASIGPDPITGGFRFIFGFNFLLGGIEFVPFLIGMVALSLIWTNIGLIIKQIGVFGSYSQQKKEEMLISRKPDDYLTFKEWLKFWREILIGFFTGVILGAIPGPGALMAGYTSFTLGKEYSIDKDNFGKGSLHGLATVEAANSATVGPTFIPLFVFGIPGSLLASIFATGLLIQGITPGPQMLFQHGDIIRGFFVLMILSNFINLIMSKFLIPLFSALARVVSTILMPLLFIICILGAYAYLNSIQGIRFLLIGSILGAFLRRWKFPIAPVLISFYIAPLLESSFRRAILLSRGSITYFFGSPITILLYVIILIMLWYHFTHVNRKLPNFNIRFSLHKGKENILKK